MASVDPRPYRLALAQAEGTLARDSAQLGVAETDLGRYERLLAQKSVALQLVDTQAGTVSQLKGTVEADRAALGVAKLNLGYTEIVAPVAGRVGLRHADVGTYVTPSDASGIFTVTVEDPIDISFAVPQNQINVLMSEPADRIGIRVQRQLDGVTMGSGHLLALDNQADVSTGTVTAKARLSNRSGLLFPNEFVNVSVTTGTLRGVAVVPVGAIRHRAQGDMLFVVSADHVAHIRTVRLGPTIDNSIVILSGVLAGEQVITTGADALDDGSRVLPERDMDADRP